MSLLAITGATGFVGSAVLAEVLAQGHQVRALARRDQAPRAGVEWVRGDLDDAAGLAALVAGADLVLIGLGGHGVAAVWNVTPRIERDRFGAAMRGILAALAQE